MSVPTNSFQNINSYDNSQPTITYQNRIPLYIRFQQQQTQQQFQRMNVQQPLVIQQSRSSIQQQPLNVSTSIMQQSQPQISTIIPMQMPSIIQQPIENHLFFRQPVVIQQTNSWNDLQQVNVFPNIPIQTYVNSTEGDQNMRKFLNTIGVKQSVEPIKRKKEEKCISFYYNLEKEYERKEIMDNIYNSDIISYTTPIKELDHIISLTDFKDSEYIEISGEDISDLSVTSNIEIKIIRNKGNERMIIHHHWYNGSIKIKRITFGVGGIVKIEIDNEYECIYVNVIERIILFEDKKFKFKKVNVIHFKLE